MPTDTARIRVRYRGVVQGVGFRPNLYRIAAELELDGFILNDDEGVLCELEGCEPVLQAFLNRSSTELPPQARLQGVEHAYLEQCGLGPLAIRHSRSAGHPVTLVLPDIATCADCVDDIVDPLNRRHRYPFTNCTNCGPRYSIIQAIPYDRCNTTMSGFTMCDACQAEYDDPANRRFHAQPNACPECGPTIALWSASGEVLALGDDALRHATHAIRAGRSIALKGLGGFQLLVDAANAEAVTRLRSAKRREEKPFAIMCRDAQCAAAVAALSEPEVRLLLSPEAPIVLVRRRSSDGLCMEVAPGNPTIGIMLPYTPIHHLLMAGLAGPVVATSGNWRDEPICTDETEALTKLRGLADLFLVHDRPIARHVDDSVARCAAGRTAVLRRARGYAPLPVDVPQVNRHAIAYGAHLKNVGAVGVDGRVFVTQHIGDLETAQAVDALDSSLFSLAGMYHVSPVVAACDLHPDYASSRMALLRYPGATRVQHHHAHIVACMAENELDGDVLGVAWDGTGLGTDGTVWGGEFLVADQRDFVRRGHLRPFRLPGGDAAVREPRRSAIGVLHALYGAGAGDIDCAATRSFASKELATALTMISTETNSPWTTSAGRLFDVVASLTGLCQVHRFEGQGAMRLEWAAAPLDTVEPYPMPVDETGPSLVVDWGPMVSAVLNDARHGRPAAEISAAFHGAMVHCILSVARLVGVPRIVLSGGCFQNVLLLEAVVETLKVAGFQPFWHQRVPPNDGCIALGQIVVASAAATKE